MATRKRDQHLQTFSGHSPEVQWHHWHTQQDCDKTTCHIGVSGCLLQQRRDEGKTNRSTRQWSIFPPLDWVAHWRIRKLNFRTWTKKGLGSFRSRGCFPKVHQFIPSAFRCNPIMLILATCLALQLIPVDRIRRTFTCITAVSDDD